MNIKQIFEKHLSTIKDYSNLDEFLQKSKELINIISNWKSKIDSIEKITNAELPFLINEELISTPERFQNYITILNYLKKRVEQRYTGAENLEEEFNALNNFFYQQKRNSKFENKKKFLEYCDVDKKIFSTCNNINLLQADIEKIIATYDTFLEGDADFQKKFAFDDETKKFRYNYTLLVRALIGLDNFTFKFNSYYWQDFVNHTNKKYKGKELKDMMREMKELKKIQEKYDMKFLFLFRAYNNIYPGCLRTSKQK